MQRVQECCCTGNNTLNLYQSNCNIGSGTFNRTSSSLDSQAVKVAPKPVERTQPTFPNDNSDKVDEKSVSDMILEKDTKALSKHMKDGIKDYLNSDQYALFLKTMGKLHNYSPKNIQLLLSQNKNISMVAGFNTWKNDFQRTVNKGEKSLKIWMPITVKQKDKNGKPKLDDDGKPLLCNFLKAEPRYNR